MMLRTKVLGLLAAALFGTTASCTFSEPGEGVSHGDGPIPGITAEVDGPDEVVKALGAPTARANGWWKDEHQFDMEFRVWYYRGVGRVIFRRDRNTVFATEADKSQGGYPN